MGQTDLYLKSRTKTRPTDLWLHLTGPDVSNGSLIVQSGTVRSITGVTGEALLADAGVLDSRTLLVGSELYGDIGVAQVTAIFAGDDLLVDAGYLFVQAFLEWQSRLIEPGIDVNLELGPGYIVRGTQGRFELAEGVLLARPRMGDLARIHFSWVQTPAPPPEERPRDETGSIVTSAGQMTSGSNGRIA